MDWTVRVRDLRRDHALGVRHLESHISLCCAGFQLYSFVSFLSNVEVCDESTDVQLSITYVCALIYAVIVYRRYKAQMDEVVDKMNSSASALLQHPSR